ncbi:hypothetical protein BBK36DRAFT_1136869 [Trichoderma citrinoviride]|uniref:Uncharacterized protein n=1 Tax=Trichoderma citrinoviride TaxID=58853 RepID=A0A2T4BLK1_9HYPO|nr:hypothetical protein BBK36DRAFT_1136869 [Trichoderma citrinoviride]PTB70195.1 hypothetical protein BBK36DRAFT_1136869 [Trichoderma citrinoviride]
MTVATDAGKSVHPSAFGSNADELLHDSEATAEKAPPTGARRPAAKQRCLRLGPRPVASIPIPAVIKLSITYKNNCAPMLHLSKGMATNSGLQIPAAVAHLYQMNAAPGGSRASRAANAMPALSSLIRASSSPNLYPRHASLEPCRRPVSPVGKSLDHAIA